MNPTAGESFLGVPLYLLLPSNCSLHLLVAAHLYDAYAREGRTVSLVLFAVMLVLVVAQLSTGLTSARVRPTAPGPLSLLAGSTYFLFVAALGVFVAFPAMVGPASALSPVIGCIGALFLALAAYRLGMCLRGRGSHRKPTPPTPGAGVG